MAIKNFGSKKCQFSKYWLPIMPCGNADLIEEGATAVSPPPPFL